MEGRAITAAMAAGCVLLTLIFLVAGFPYERLESRIVRAIEASVDGRMTYAESEQVFTFAGPGYLWRNVRLSGTTPRPLTFESVETRLAWSLSWLRLAPAFHVELDGAPGRAIGVVTLGGRPGFDGRLEQFQLAELPRRLQPDDFTISGVADADLDLAGGEQLIGKIELEVADGSLNGGPFRASLPFRKLSGKIELVGDNRAEIASLKIASPLLQADVVGSVGPAATLGEAPLDLAVELDADVRATPLLVPFGIKLTKRGPQSLKLSGTLNSPKVR